MDFLIISSSFSFLYRSSSITAEGERKILEKSQSIATYTRYVISKFQLNPFSITAVINFLQNF